MLSTLPASVWVEMIPLLARHFGLEVKPTGAQRKAARQRELEAVLDMFRLHEED